MVKLNYARLNHVNRKKTFNELYNEHQNIQKIASWKNFQIEFIPDFIICIQHNFVIWLTSQRCVQSMENVRPCARDDLIQIHLSVLLISNQLHGVISIF